jgi:hypothetical protein
MHPPIPDTPAAVGRAPCRRARSQSPPRATLPTQMLTTPPDRPLHFFYDAIAQMPTCTCYSRVHGSMCPACCYAVPPHSGGSSHCAASCRPGQSRGELETSHAIAHPRRAVRMPGCRQPASFEARASEPMAPAASSLRLAAWRSGWTKPHSEDVRGRKLCDPDSQDGYASGHQKPLLASRCWNSSTLPVATLSVAGLPVHLV